MSYYGSWAIDDNLTFCVNTTKFDTGVATDADAVPAYRVYEDETGTPILTGNMALIDSANTAGFYSEQIALSAANGFEVGKCYSIYIAATVNSVAGATHHNFQVGAKVNTTLWNALPTVELPLVPTTAGRKLDVSAGGEAGVDWANVGSPTTAVDLSGTNIKTNQKVDVETIKTGAVVNGGTVTFPTNSTLASTTNITAGTVAVATALGSAYDAAKTAAQAGDAMALTAGERTTLTAAIWAYVVTGTTTAVQAMRGFIAAMLGKASGLEVLAPKYRNIADTKNVIDATTDADGNRTAVTLDLT